MVAGWIKDAEAASNRKEYKRAYVLFRNAADAGDQCGQYRLGDMYEFGRGLTSSTSSAVYWYKKAAAQNGMCSVPAKYALDRLTKTVASGSKSNAATVESWFRSGVAAYNEQNYTSTLKWYGKAAEQGHAGAQNNLGFMYNQGRGVRQNFTEAVKWYRKAADQGDARAQTNLGYMYGSGQGVAKSDTEAVKWYRKAAAGGDAYGQCNFALVTAQGKGTDKDPTSAADWAIKSLQNGGEICIAQMTEPDTVREIQKILKQRGLYAGAIDGSNGPNTQAAMRKLLPN